MNEEDQYRQAFGEHINISHCCRDEIDQLKNNESDDNFFPGADNAAQFTDLASKLIGRYITNNNTLRFLDLDDMIDEEEGIGLTNEKMSLLFGNLVRSSSLEVLNLKHNPFGVDGLRSMVPFLENSPQLSTLNLEGINSIGKEGCIILSNVLRKEVVALEDLVLTSTGLNDEGVEILAASLKHNTNLKKLVLLDNDNITERGYRALFKLLADISSVESTCNSNHTLRKVQYTKQPNVENKFNDIWLWINYACCANATSNPLNTKVYRYQLDSEWRKELCRLQGIEFSPSNMLADIETNLLPTILSSIAEENGQSELYAALIPTAPDLLSYLDRKALIKDTMRENVAKDNALTAEYERKVAALKTELLVQKSYLAAHNNELSNRLALIESGDKGHKIEGGNRSVYNGTKKRQRDV